MATATTTYHSLTGDNIIDSITNGYQWSLDPTKTLDVSISNGFSGEYWYNPTTTSTYFLAALNTFSTYANISFNYIGIYSNPSMAAWSGSEINLSLDGVGRFMASPNTWAIGFFPNSSYDTAYYPGAPGDLYININSAANQLPTYAPSSQGWFLLLHELGHALGLKHPHDNGGTNHPTFTDLGIESLDIDWATIMSYNDDSSINLYNWDPASPMLLDVLGIMYLYGKNMNTNIGNTTFLIKELNTYITLWDAGGIDTLDASSANGAWTIHLPDIVLSTLVNEKIGFALPTTELSLSSPHTLEWLIGDYENVIGSNFNDTIFGNNLNNSIIGGGGIDTIRGGDGNDTITGGLGNDILYGEAGNDLFDWDSSQRGGEDIFFGGAGNDIYVVTPGDIVIESANQGVDTIWTYSSYSLTESSYVEYLKGFGSDNLVLGGSSRSDTFVGSLGNDTINGSLGTDKVIYSGSCSTYQLIRKNSSVIEVQDQLTNRNGTDSIISIEHAEFDDFIVNLTIQNNANLIGTSNLTRLEELYVAFFNRIPDADGLEYWINQLHTGKNINDIANSFYAAGVQYSNLTGFSSSMSNITFINKVYLNVLGRSEGADQEGLNYWNNQLSKGVERGTLVSTILDAAHGYKGDATWGWVANLLDNKIQVANDFAISMGLNYKSATESINKGMAIAAAVTPNSTDIAISLIGVNSINIDLT